MTQILSTDPALSIPAPDPIGRLYRLPGSEPLSKNGKGEVIVPSESDLLAGVNSGKYLPSITNVIDVLNKPYLIGWGAKVALEKSIEVERQYPGRLMSNPRAGIAYLKKESERIRDAAATKGTKIHEACEYLAKGLSLADLPGEPLNAEEMRYVDSWQRWADLWQPEFLALELTVFGKTPEGLGYAGTTDFIAKINGRIVAGDLKTTRSGLHNEVALQLTAVCRAQECSPDDRKLQPNYDIESAIAVHLDVSRPTVKQVSLSDGMWSTFRGLRSAWTFNSFDGKIASDDQALSHPLTSPDMLS